MVHCWSKFTINVQNGNHLLIRKATLPLKMKNKYTWPQLQFILFIKNLIYSSWNWWPLLLHHISLLSWFSPVNQKLLDVTPNIQLQPITHCECHSFLHVVRTRIAFRCILAVNECCFTFHLHAVITHEQSKRIFAWSCCLQLQRLL